MARDFARVGIQHAIGAQADELLRGNDFLPHLDDHERLTRLTGCLGDVATDLAESWLCDDCHATLHDLSELDPLNVPVITDNAYATVEAATERAHARALRQVAR